MVARRVGFVLLAVAACSGRVATPPPRVPPPARPIDPLAGAAIMKDLGWLCDPARQGRGSYQPGGRAAADYMARELAAAGLEVVRQPVGNGADNVIALARGDADAILISAHYDHLGVDDRGTVYPGADDNASGASVLLAIARAERGQRHRHTLVFAAFGAEEEGLVGSGVYVRDPTWPLAHTLAVINFDMVGRRFFELAGGRDATCAVVGLEADAALAASASRAASQHGLGLVTVPARAVELFGFQDRTDEWWFRRRGVLAIHFSTSLHDDYHQPTDTPDKIVPAQLERIARTARDLLDFAADRWDRQAGRTGRPTTRSSSGAARGRSRR